MKQLAFFLLAACVLCAAAGARADVPAGARRGAELYRDSAYGEAAEAFRQATIAAPDDPRWRYDLGLSEARAGQFEGALGNLETSGRADDPEIAGAALYNAGNVHYAAGDFAAAAESFREALLRRPDDADAKRNLELALRQLMQQQQQQQQQPDSSGQQEEEERQDRQDEGDQNQESPNGQPDDSNQDPGDDSLDAQPEADSSLTREQAERILKALADEEARLRDQAKRLRAIPAPGGKDW